jgi:hypothetical protein
MAEQKIARRGERSSRLSQHEASEIKPTILYQVTQTGSSLYSPYTSILSVLRTQNPLLRPVSTIQLT